MAIPSIVMMGLALTFCTKFGFIENPNFKRNGVNCCGCICLFRPILGALARDLTCIYMKHHLKEHPGTDVSMKAHQHRLVICNSFFGLEPGEAVPPNVVLTGPFYDSPTDLLPVLKEKDDKLYDWLD
jgi:hypothetical protein